LRSDAPTTNEVPIVLSGDFNAPQGGRRRFSSQARTTLHSDHRFVACDLVAKP
jgi:hypothetical protein